jgi:Dolichyl-phosphate-mannose-protein mannosyltransferase
VPVLRDRTEVLLAAALLVSLVLVTPRISESDAIEYFSYLPSMLVDGDLDFTNQYTRFYLEDPVGRAGFKETFLDRSTATGLKLNFGPIGSAVLWSPFYLATHAIVGGDGMAQPYRTAAAFASAIYGLVGLFLCYRLARRYQSPFCSLAAVVTLWWATPVAYYLYIAPGMSHACSLFAVSVFLTLGFWASKGGVGRWAVWGASCGLMTLVYEMNLFFSVAALVFGLSPTLRSSLADRVKRFAAFGAAALAVFSPQLVVYQILNGRPLPSPHVGNKMDWLSPHFLQVLFSPGHGLFFWSPVLLLFVAFGLVFIFLEREREREAGLALLLGFLSQVYVCGAVDSWTQAGAFGSRRFVGVTAIFAIWGAAAFAALEPRIKRFGIAALASVFMLWNVGLMMQFGLGIMNRDKLEWSRIARNQVDEIPAKFFDVIERYLVARDELEGSK